MSYASVDLLFVAGGFVVFAWAAARTPRRARFVAAVVATGLVLVLLTLVFDTAMIRADLFRYGADALLGARVGVVPVEDLAWPVAAALVVPSVGVLVGRDELRTSGGGHDH